MTKDEDKLIEDNMNLAYKIAWDYNKKLPGLFELEELQAVALLGLVKAAKTFDMDKRFEFSTYSYKVIKNELLHFINREKPLNKPISLSNPLTDDLFLEDTLASNYDLEEKVQTDIRIDYLYKFIYQLEKIDQIILLYLLDGLTMKQIAKKLNTSEHNIYQKYRKAINKLRYRFFRYEGGEI